MRLRFVMAYFITMAAFVAMFWYFVRFTSTYGWSISWKWFYNGIFAVVFQYAVYDVGLAFAQWIVHWCSKSLSLFWMSIRVVKMCRREA